MINCHGQRCKKKIEKLQQLNEELKKSAEAMQKIVKGQYMIQEALDKKVQKLERELYQARMKNWAATPDKTVSALHDTNYSIIGNTYVSWYI